MAFSRDDLAAYEKQPQKMVDDKVSPFRGATPARAADPAAVAAVAAGQVDATPGGNLAADQAASAPSTDDSPVVDEDGTLGDPTESGEGTSDDPTSASSTDPVEHGDVADPNTDLTGDDPAPKKGSARERIVELLDLTEGYKEYGKMKADEVKALREQLASLSQPTSSVVAPVAPTAPVTAEADEPMPDMADDDVAFDSDKYRAKMMKWVNGQTERAAERAIRKVNGASTAQQAMQAVAQKCEAFAKDHTDFEEVVAKNPVLAANQLAPDAAALVGESDHTAALLYKFGKDPGFAIRVARQSPRQQIVTVSNMIRDIEEETKKPAASQGGTKPTPKKSITQAPPPPRPTTAAGRADGRSVTDPNMSMDEFARQHRQGKQSARENARKQRGLS